MSRRRKGELRGGQRIEDGEVMTGASPDPVGSEKPEEEVPDRASFVAGFIAANAGRPESELREDAEERWRMRYGEWAGAAPPVHQRAGEGEGREKDGGSYTRLDDPNAEQGLLRHVVVRTFRGQRGEDVAAFRYARDAQGFVERQDDPSCFSVRKQDCAMVGVSGHGHAILAALERSDAARQPKGEARGPADSGD